MRVGIIGVGSMGQNHARICSEVADLVGVCDTDVDVGKQVAKKFRTRFYLSHEDLFAQGLDGVSIATPTSLHFETAREAINHGLHVLLEKPFCGDVEKAEKLTDMANDQGVVLAAGMVERHNPAVEFAHHALRKGEFGRVIAASSRRVSSFPTRMRDVGVMMDLGIHDVDVMRYLVGSKVVKTYGVAGRERHDTFEDHAIAVLTFETGVNGIVEVNWLTPMKVRKLSLTCLKNSVELDYINQSLEISSSTLKEYDPSDLYQATFEYDVRQVVLKKREPLRNEIEDFLQAIEGGGKPLVDGKEVVETLKVIRDIIDSHVRGVSVETG